MIGGGRAALLRAYDEHLRGGAELLGATTVTRLGPLWLAVYPGGQGFATYSALGSVDAAAVYRLVARARDHFLANASVTAAEWKTRGHDAAPGLHDSLMAHGFAREAPESIMVGHARDLATEVPLPAGVELRRVRAADEVRSMSAMQDAVFGGPASPERAEALLARLERGDGLELWVAEAAGDIVSAGRLEPVAGTPFAGLWGGATLPAWRGRGIYRALTAARARSALALGKTLLHSDSTEFSRPILERAGLTKVSTTTPFVWRRTEPLPP